jgi:hypothetical protein
MLTIPDLEARALRRADQVEDADRLLRAARWRLRTGRDDGDSPLGFWARLAGRLWPSSAARRVAKLERDHRRAEAAFKIAVDELLQAHCAALRSAPWSQGRVAGVEAAVRSSSTDYGPWRRSLALGESALDKLRGLGAGRPGFGDAARILTLATGGIYIPRLSPDAESIDAMREAGEALGSFISSLDHLPQTSPARNWPHDGPNGDPARSRPAPSAGLRDCARRMAEVRTRLGVAAVESARSRAMREVASLLHRLDDSSRDERGDLDAARSALEAANQQLILAAWSKIPARLRPIGR